MFYLKHLKKGIVSSFGAIRKMELYRNQKDSSKQLFDTKMKKTILA